MNVGAGEARPKSKGKAVRKGRLELLGMGQSCYHEKNFIFFREASVLLLNLSND